MFLCNKLLNIVNARIHQFGAQYTTFAIFGLINYPLSLAYEYYINNNHGAIIRVISTLLCLILLLKDKWPIPIQRYLSLYWYCTITICLPFVASYLLLKNNLSLDWLINFNIGTLITVLLLDAMSFLVVQVIGIMLGVSIFYLLGNSISHFPSSENFSLFLYMFFWTVVLGSIFSRSREIFNHIIQTRLEEAVKQRTIELEDAIAFKTEYLNNMSHEIRTPVQGFTVFAKILVDQWDAFSEEKRLELATKVSENAERLKKLVTNLLDLSKHTSGQWVLNIERFDISKLVESIIDEARNLYIFEKKIDIIILSSQKEVLVTADYALIGQVLRNLFANAVKFSREENGKLEATVNISDDLYLHFSLKDKGIGVPEVELQAIFDEFVQSSRTNTMAGGTGLGLALCKKIIKLHHGRIWAENNEDGVGSNFHFMVPMNYDKNNQPMLEPEPTTIRKEEKRPKTLLLIDDEAHVITSISLVFEQAGFRVHGFTSATEGLNYAKMHFRDFDIILLDLMMPILSGVDVLKILKHNKKLGHLPVILHTGASNTDELKEALDIGVAACIKKPYSNKEIVDLVQEILSR